MTPKQQEILEKIGPLPDFSLVGLARLLTNAPKTVDPKELALYLSSLESRLDELEKNK